MRGSGLTSVITRPPGKRWVGVDVDKQMDRDTGEWTNPDALDLLMGLYSYSEVSPSGSGAQIPTHPQGFSGIDSVRKIVIIFHGLAHFLIYNRNT
jgi:primase-polymerase (primpol)-like protein